MDLASAGLSLSAVLLVIYGLKRIAEDGWTPLALVSIALGLGVGAIFVHRQRGLTHPLIDLSLFRSAGFSASVAINILGALVAFGSFLFTAQYLQLVLGLSPLEAGIWTLPSALGFVATSFVVPILAKRIRPAYLITGGLAVVAASFALLSQVGGPNSLAIIVVGTVSMSLGLGPVFILPRFDRQRRPAGAGGSRGGDLGDRREFGGVLGIAILGSIGIRRSIGA
jgi:DHA2 family multidrug resistance protein-like MFS transporter